MIKQNCLFCNIANGMMEAATIFENSEFRVILDKFPASKGHTLIIPKDHIENIYEIEGETAGKIFALATLIANELKNILHCDGMNILQNNGKVAGQTVFHFHIHLIPRYENDGLKFEWETKEFTDAELAELADNIAKKI